MYLGITVLATIMLYYELYVGGSVSTLFLVKLHMSFSFFVYTLAIGNLIGAFGSLFAGLTDRLGRTNIVVIGLVITAVFVAFIIPASTNKWEFTIFGFIVGFVEGICLVATPALIRDFSPQVGRATAMGFWTSGPVLGSLVVFVVASHAIHGNPSPSFWVTLVPHLRHRRADHLRHWPRFGLRELSPGLRDQLMVSMQDRALIEARAKGIDIEASLRNPWGQLLKPDVIVSALGVALFLLIYYTAVGFALIYFTTVFGFSVHDGNALGNWNWGFNVIAVILFGFISDKLRVRKPLMIARRRRRRRHDRRCTSTRSANRPATTTWRFCWPCWPSPWAWPTSRGWRASPRRSRLVTRRLPRPVWPSGAGSSGWSCSARTCCCRPWSTR